MIRRPRAAWVLISTLVLLAAFATSCDGVPYVLHVAAGQLAVQANTEPIDAVLASGRLSADDATKLRLIVQARDYAASTLGLKAGASYTTFYDTHGGPLAWNLSAARRDALVPKTWTFPIVGAVPYLAFFGESYLSQVERQLIFDGYDTQTYELDAYSTLGYFVDPVRSTMLRRGTVSLVETVIHELLHNTVWRADATVFNESLATFVGRQGAVEFLRAELGDGSGWPQQALDYYADTDQVNVFLAKLYDDLQAYYAQPLSSAEKIAGREAVFQAARDRFASEVAPTLKAPDAFKAYGSLPTNNAWVLAHHRYNLDLAVFAAVYDAAAHQWPAALDVFQAAAAAAGDPFEYLRNWLTERAAPTSQAVVPDSAPR